MFHDTINEIQNNFRKSTENLQKNYRLSQKDLIQLVLHLIRETPNGHMTDHSELLKAVHVLSYGASHIERCITHCSVITAQPGCSTPWLSRPSK